MLHWRPTPSTQGCHFHLQGRSSIYLNVLLLLLDAHAGHQEMSRHTLVLSRYDGTVVVLAAIRCFGPISLSKAQLSAARFLRTGAEREHSLNLPVL